MLFQADTGQRAHCFGVQHHRSLPCISHRLHAALSYKTRSMLRSQGQAGEGKRRRRRWRRRRRRWASACRPWPWQSRRCMCSPGRAARRMMRAWLPLPPRVWWPALQLRWPPYAHLFGGDAGRMAAACLVAGWPLCALLVLIERQAVAAAAVRHALWLPPCELKTQVINRVGCWVSRQSMCCYEQLLCCARDCRACRCDAIVVGSSPACWQCNMSGYMCLAA